MKHQELQMWMVYYKTFRCDWMPFFKSLHFRRDGSIKGYLMLSETMKDWRKMKAKGDVKCVKVLIIPKDGANGDEN